MANGNYKLGIKRQYARWLGERVQLERDIARIEKSHQLLAEKRSRLELINKVTAATVILMSELDPTWRPEGVKPQHTNRQALPWEHGSTTKTAFSIMREIGKPISILELSKVTIARLSDKEDVRQDPDILDRVRSNLDNSLRNAKDFVRNIGGRPSRWEIIPLDEMDLGPPDQT
ncbi:MAG: hypothetical protein ACOY7T_06670 [Pseudomonadota bacterium]